MAVKYIPFSPNILNGQAVLDNFVRTQRILRYHGDEKVEASIRQGMPLYDVEMKEQRGPKAADNLIIRGTCVSTCAYLKSKGITVDLVYIDPPFDSGANYAKKVYVRRNPKVAEAIRQAEEELEIDELKTFEEKMYGDVWNKEDYLNWMYANLMAIKSVMSDTASIYVHLDYHIGHYVKILMDEIFGEDNFRNEIIWKRSTAHNDSTGFANLHDTIFYYSKSSDLYFDTPMVPYSDEYLDHYYNKQDEDGRKYLDRDLSAKGLKGSGYSYSWKGKEGYWRCPFTTMERLEKEGRLYYTSNGTPRYKQYLDEMEGVPAQDLWTDIYAVNSQAEERVDYATQKPIDLLERIISASSNEGMLVADFFGGSGVTAKAANKLGRRFVHADIGINSIQVTRDKLVEMGVSFTQMEVNDGIKLFRNPQQTNDKLLELTGVSRNPSLESFWAGSINDSNDGMVPVYMPSFLPGKRPMLDEAFLGQLVFGKLGYLPDGTRKVIVYYVDSIPSAEREAFVHDKSIYVNINVEFRDLKAVLDQVVVDDEAEYTLEEVTPEGQMFSVWRLTMQSFTSDRVMQKISAVNETRHAQYLKKLADYRNHIEENQQKGKKEPTFTRINISDEGLETIEWLSLDCENSAKDAPWHSSVEVKIDRNGYVILNGRKTDQLWDGTIQTEDNSQKPLRMKIRNICGDETVFVL